MLGREIDKGTEASRQNMVAYTGVQISGCPWRSFSVPIVRETISAIRFFESGNLAVALPNPSHRLIEAIGFWKQVYGRVQQKQFEHDRDKRKSEAAVAQAQHRMNSHVR